jgi:hypothetical protein
MKNFRAIIGVIGIIAGIGFSGTAHAGECANYPTVAWLGNLTHEKVFCTPAPALKATEMLIKKSGIARLRD